MASVPSLSYGESYRDKTKQDKEFGRQGERSNVGIRKEDWRDLDIDYLLHLSLDTW